MKSCLCLFFVFFILSCAEKKSEYDGDDEHTIIYGASSKKSPYFSCNRFADETFRGDIYIKSGCAYIDINKSPKDLFDNRDLFLQMYAFSIKSGEMEYSSSIAFKTVERGNREKALMQSEIINTDLVKAELNLNPNTFFKNHSFEICDLEETWDGLQLVVYKKRIPPPSISVRVTKFLLPPFLVHPEQFRDNKGDVLAGLHPLLKLIPKMNFRPSAYYDYAEEVCDEF